MKLSLSALVLLIAPSLAASNSTCKCTPLDDCWPSQHDWSSLNDTLSGRLLKPLPLASVCHDPYYNATACAELKAAWWDPMTHINTPTSPQFRLFAGSLCTPYTPRSAPCEIGNTPVYAILAESADDISAGLAFARKHNVRLVVRNTGHDLLGKSSGFGALAIGLQSFKERELVQGTWEGYSGPAIRLGAGVLGFEAGEFAAERNLTLVGGDCPTVGIAGGYTQGGGHSPLSNLFGLSADQVLSASVVLANGTQLTAPPDLLWALSGGGAGTYAITTSITLKANPTFLTTTAFFSFAAPNATDTGITAFWAAVEFYQSLTPAWVDKGIFAISSSSYSGRNASSPLPYFVLLPLLAPYLDTPGLQALLAPLFTKLSSLGITHSNPRYRSFPTYWEAYTDFFDNESGSPYGQLKTGNSQYGSRLIPRRVIEENVAGFVRTIREIAEGGGGVGELGLQPRKPQGMENAVLPAWRDAVKFVLITTPWNDTTSANKTEQDAERMTWDWDAKLRDIAGEGSGTYLAEADPREPEWQESFYGCNYGRLLEVKKDYDPEGLFWARTTVGSEAWAEDEVGRLCRV